MEVSRGLAREITGQLNARSAQTIAQWIGCYGVVWNCKVAENQAAYQAYLQKRELDPAAARPLPDQKAAHFQTEERPWLAEVPAEIRRNAAAKWREAMQAGFAGLRAFPTFRRASGKMTYFVTKELFVVVETKNGVGLGL